MRKCSCSPRSKRFRKVFRTFEAFFAIWPRENWDERFFPSIFFRARPNFRVAERAKNASNVPKTLRKRLLMVNCWLVKKWALFPYSEDVARLFFLTNCRVLRWYCVQKLTSIFSSVFETLFTKHSPSEILSLNFDKKTVENCNFPI